MNKKYFIFVISIVLLSIFSVNFVSARHSWWHFWGEEVQFANYYQCGNSVIDVGEVCDGGSGGSSGAVACTINGYNGYKTCRSDCLGYNNCFATEKCGDKIVQNAAGEQCDDGNLINGDGCSATCKKEKTCASFGYNEGTLGNCCDASCTNYDLSSCKNTSKSCIDGDGGLDYFNYAIVSYSFSTKSGISCDGGASGGAGGAGSLKDICFGNILTERFCDENKSLKSVNYTCLDGCLNGACKKLLNLTNQTCIDSDGGINVNKFGILNITNKTGLHQFKDFCSGGDVNEYFCNADGKTKNITLFNCEAGCLDGKCVVNATNQTSCTDSDGGRKQDVKGTAKECVGDKCDSETDVCLNSTIVLENYCTKDKLASESIFCNLGCFDGACKLAGNETNQTTSICGNKILEGLEEECDDGNKINGDGCSALCKKEIVEGKILRVSRIINSTVGFSNDEVQLIDIRTGDTYPVDIIAEGVGDVSIGGLVYKIRYKGASFDENKWMEIEDFVGIPLEAKTGIQRVFRNSYIIIGNPEWDGRILEVSRIQNDTSSPMGTGDVVELKDIKSEEAFKALITAEGTGTITIDGLIHNVKYFDIFHIEGDERIEISGGRVFGGIQGVFKRSFIILSPIVIAQPICGNGKVERANVEACDDGNLINGDGCSDKCRFENTSACTDSDGGFNTSTKGFASADGVRIEDECVDNSTLYEAECDANKNGTIDGELIFCQNGCENGMCLGNNCRLASASWGVASSPVGVQVTLAVAGSDCKDQEVSFEVREKDVVSADDPVGINPPKAKFVNGVANSQWIVENQLDEGLTKPEYYFVARLVSDPETDIASGLLQVI